MLFSDYQYMARRTQNPDLKLWQQREHALYGLASEVGEVLGLHQKAHQGHVIDDTDVLMECGDILWFVAELCDVYGFSMDDVARSNIQKLQARYQDKFTVEESLHRDEAKEKSRSRYYTEVPKNAERAKNKEATAGVHAGTV